MAPWWICFLLLLFSFVCQSTPAQIAGGAGSTADNQAEAYPNTVEGFTSLIQAILQAAKAKDTEKEDELVHGLLIPADSTWFRDEYGPGFGASLTAAYRRAMPDLEQAMKTIYEGNVKRGWMTPKILRYTDPESVNAPLDSFLNCMDHIAPLYTTEFQGNSMSTYFSSGRPDAGDLDGYFIYDQSAFRFIPMQVLMKFRSQRPLRIRLDMGIMRSKLLGSEYVPVPEEAVRKRISGKVVAQITVDVSGNVKEVKVTEGDPILSGAVIDTVKHWRFAPTLLDGDPVEVELEGDFTFATY